MKPIEIHNALYKKFSDLIDAELKKSDSVLSEAKEKTVTLYDNSTPDQKVLLEDIRFNFKSFLLLSPSEQEKLVKPWGEKSFFYDFPKRTKKGARRVRKTTKFGREIIKALNFDRFREKYSPLISEYTGVKTCPYCNAMLTVPIVNSQNKKKARYHLDHYFPKSKFPLLSISFFNLIPSCGQCNIVKSSKTPKLGVDFHLYYDSPNDNDFIFHIPDEIVADFLSSKIKANKLKITFGEKNNKKAKVHDENFSITSLYHSQIDVAEELLQKSQAYSPSKIAELATLMNLPEAVVQRMIIGSYADKEDIHKRPLTKMIQDISRQLGLIK